MRSSRSLPASFGPRSRSAIALRLDRMRVGEVLPQLLLQIVPADLP